MKLRDLLRERYKILLGFECCHEFQKELDTDENDEFLDRIEHVIGKWLDREVLVLKGVKPVEFHFGDTMSGYKCGECRKNSVWATRYGNKHKACPICGTKIDWEEREQHGT